MRLFGKTIFTKLFTSFALTVLIAGFGAGITIFYFSHRSFKSVRHRVDMQRNMSIARSMAAVGKAAYVIYENRGSAALVQYVQEINEAMRSDFFLLVNEVSYPEQVEIPQVLRELIVSARQAGELQFTDISGALFVASPFVSDDGIPCVIAGRHRLPPPPFPPDRKPPKDKQGGPPFPRNVLAHAVIFFTIIGLVCYWLARSFSLPINRLRGAAQQVAAGDLSSRVDMPKKWKGSELNDLALDFNDMASRLEQLVQYQKRLLIDISHELRSPLARIGVALELARQKGDGQNNGMLDKVEKEVGRLNDLIGQLLRLPNPATQHVEKIYFDLAVLVKDVVDDVSFEMQQQDKQVEIQGSMQEIPFHGSEELIRQAIENVIRNGACYTPPGTSVEVRLAVQDAPAGDGREAVVTVRDYGPGIPEEEIALVFEPFYRVSAARERLENDTGVGIGLSITHQVMRQHGGRVSLTNVADGPGLIAALFLPLE